MAGCSWETLSRPAPLRAAEALGGQDCCAVIVAGGSGERFGNPGGKQLYPICGLPMVVWSIAAFDAAPSVACMVLVCPAADEQHFREAVSELELGTPLLFAEAGSTRQLSCAAGLAAAPDGLPLIAVHDGARPLIRTRDIERAIAALRDEPDLAGAVCGHPAIDTLKEVDGGLVTATPDRSRFWTVQTPQVFRKEQLAAAYERAAEEGFAGTDDASLVEHAGGAVRMVECPRDNLKVTVPEDVAYVEAILEGRIVREALPEEAE